jgi:Flp pilus assembly protein TadG
MMRLQKKRRGATVVEVAVIMPFMVAIVVISIDLVGGIYRYHQLATLARAAARYASVHAGQYKEETGNPVATVSSIRTEVLEKSSYGLDLNKMTCTLDWLPTNNNYPWRLESDTGAKKQNSVRVKLSYPWKPVTLMLFPVTLTSTSEVANSY